MFTTNKEFRPPALSQLLSKPENSGFNIQISLVKSDDLCHPCKCDLVQVGCICPSLSLLSDLIKRAGMRLASSLCPSLQSALWATYWGLVFTWRPVTDAAIQICYKCIFTISIISVLLHLNECLWVFSSSNYYFVKLCLVTVRISLSFSLKAVMMQKTMKELNGWGERLFTWELLP